MAKDPSHRPIRAALFIGPAFLHLCIWLYYPVLRNILLSFQESNPADPVRVDFVGLSNYRRLLSDDLFYRALWHNIVWVILSIAIPVAAGLLLATLLVKRRSRLFYSLVYFLPVTVAPVMAAIVWGWIYNPTFGALNALLHNLGLGGLQQHWLGNPSLALFSVNLIGSWGYFGFCTLIFLAGLQSIDPEVYDAARIDGATALRSFLFITVPLLKGTIFFVVAYTMISSMKFFDHVYVATKGGPNNSTQIVSVYMFDLFIRQGEVNYASAMSVVLTLLILLLSIVVIRQLIGRSR